jgi:hypothetical protein
MPKLTINGLWTQFVAPLRDLEDFTTHGSLRGLKGGAGYTGQLPYGHWGSAQSAQYVVYSYNTPIAWLDRAGFWQMPAVKYSVTTSKSQGRILTALRSFVPDNLLTESTYEDN